MCRSIRPLFNYDPPATRDEIEAAARQYVRKISGFTKPSLANRDVFEQGVKDLASITERLLQSLTTTQVPSNREVELQKSRERYAKRQSGNSKP